MLRRMRILDVSCGNRAVWFDKQNPLATYIDIRPEVSPDVVADSRDLKGFADGSYDLVVFDPPHKNNGPQFGMARSYGCHTADEITDIIRRTAVESYRVTRP